MVGKLSAKSTKNKTAIHCRKLKYSAMPGPISTPRSPVPMFRGYGSGPRGPCTRGCSSSRFSNASSTEGGMYTPRDRAMARLESFFPVSGSTLGSFAPASFEAPPKPRVRRPNIDPGVDFAAEAGASFVGVAGAFSAA